MKKFIQIESFTHGGNGRIMRIRFDHRIEKTIMPKLENAGEVEMDSDGRLKLRLALESDFMGIVRSLEHHIKGLELGLPEE
jgi:hypothetical protein